MKKILTLIASAAIIMGCQKDNAGTPDNGSKPLGTYRITADLADARTSMASDGKTSWIAGDELGVALVSGSNLTSNIQFTYVVGDAAFLGSDLTNGSPYMAYYPYNASFVAGGKIAFALPATQQQAASGVSGDIIDAYDYLYSSQATASTTTNFQMHHALSLFHFTITPSNVTAGDKLNSISVFDPAGNSFATTISVDASGVFTYGGFTNKVTLKTGASGTTLANGTVYEGWLMVARDPSVAAPTPLTIIAETTKGSITLNAAGSTPTSGINKTTAYEKGKPYGIVRSIDLNNASIVVNGEYVILGKTGDEYYAVTNTATTTGGRLNSVLSDYDGSSASITTDDASIVWTVAKSGSNYTLRNNGNNNYLSWSSGNAATTISTAYNLTIANSDDAPGTFWIRSAATPERYFSLNASTAPKSFAFYTGTLIDDLYIIPASILPLPKVTVDEITLPLDYNDISTNSIGFQLTNATVANMTISRYEGTEGTTACTWLTAVVNANKIDITVPTANSGAARTARVVLKVTTTVEGIQRTDEATITVNQSAAGAASWENETFAAYAPLNGTETSYNKSGTFVGVTTGTPTWNYSGCGNTNQSNTDRSALITAGVAVTNAKYITMGKSGSVNVTIPGGITELKFNALVSSNSSGTVTVTANGATVASQSIPANAKQSYSLSGINCGGYNALITFTCGSANNRLTIGDVSWIPAN